MLARHIYLRTEYAWYILDRPADEYATFFAPFWTTHFVFHTLMTSASANRRLTYPEFLERLWKSDVPQQVVGHDIGPQHVSTHSTVIVILNCPLMIF